MATQQLTETVWTDRKRYLWILGLVAPGCALLPSQLVYYTKLPLFWWIGPLIIFVLIPTLDAIVGEDGQNPPDEVVEKLTGDRYYRWCTYLFLPILYIGLIISSVLWHDHGLSTWDKIGLAVTMGLVNGIGINAAHELGHRAERYEQSLAKVALAPTLYGHFFVEHNRGHHVKVATPDDPASSRFGESLWEFLPRAIVNSFRSAMQLERKRLERSGSGFWTYRNNILQSWAMSIVLFGSLMYINGAEILPYLLLQALLAIFLLETVNYVEHYGLLRTKRLDGRYERCTPRHSWNSDRLVTNIFLFHLQRHSDHHANPLRRYQTLRSCDESPQLPAGYATMVLCAMVPPLWRRVMNPRVLAHYEGDITKVNISPRRRTKILETTTAAAA